MLAFVLLRTCGIGRASAVGSPGAKLLSLVLVTAGLVICSLDDGAAPTIPTSAAGGGIAGAPRVHLSASPILRPVNDSSSAFYSSYHFAPVLHSLRGGNAHSWPEPLTPTLTLSPHPQRAPSTFTLNVHLYPHPMSPARQCLRSAVAEAPIEQTAQGPQGEARILLPHR